METGATTQGSIAAGRPWRELLAAVRQGVFSSDAPSPATRPPVPNESDDDVRTLSDLGYTQELDRRMGAFSNYAVSMSIICVLAGGITSFPAGLCASGGGSVGIGWPLGCLVSLAFAATMAEVASAFPTAGGLYHWSAILGGRGWGWATAWFNLAGLVTVLAAIDLALVQFCFGAFAPLLGWSDAEAGATLATLVAGTPAHALGTGASPAVALSLQWLAVGAVLASQAAFNHFGIRVTSAITDSSGWAILLLTTLLTVALLAWAPAPDPSRLFEAANFTGLPEGGPVWPRTGSTLWALALGLLLPAYTLTGFDASAHVAEETLHAAREVPRAIVRAVAVSAVAGWILLAAIVTAIPDMEEAVRQGGNAFFWTLEEVLPLPVRTALLAGIAATQYVCGLAAVTSTSRMVYAFARDGGLPFSPLLRRVSTAHKTPSAAIWTVAVAAALFTALVPYLTITAVCAILLYVSYCMPTAVGLFTRGKGWTRRGPWSIGAMYRPLAVVCVLACAGLFVVGIQPPNAVAGRIVPGFAAGLAVWWFAFKRRHFPGPPSLSARAHDDVA